MQRIFRHMMYTTSWHFYRMFNVECTAMNATGHCISYLPAWCSSHYSEGTDPV